MKTLRVLVALVPVVVATAACEATKSSNPLSPSVAGPIAGVNISTPKMLEPVPGAQIDSTKQPLTLLIENASSTGVRPLTYTFEVAIDAGFSNKVFQRDGVLQGDGGRTSLRLPDPLASGRSYYWRVRAEDGANIGPYANAASFNVFTPVVIGEPVLLSPINNTVVSDTHPRFSIGNALRSRPAGVITYTIEIADSDTLSNKIAIWTVAEQSGQTNLDAPANLGYSKQYFWHARGADTNTTGPWSAAQAFQTPAPPAAPAPGGGGGGGGPIGDWQHCSAFVSQKDKLSSCVHDAVNPGSSAEAAFEVTKRIAWLLRGEGGGLLIKNGGENIVFWQGYWFSAGRICYPDGHIYKVLTDVGGANGATWGDNGFVDRSLYVPAINPGS